MSTGSTSGNRGASREPAIDPDTLAELRDLLDGAEPDALRTLIGIFLTDTGRRLASLREAVHQADTSVIVSTAHALKGSCATFGARPMARVCSRLEAEARSPGPVTTSSLTLLAQLETEYDRMRAALPDDLTSA